MSDYSIIDRQDALRDNGPMAESRENPTLYEALMAIKPPGLTPNAWALKAELNRNVFNDIRKNGRAAHDTIQRLVDAAASSLAELETKLRGDMAPEAGAADIHENPFKAFRGSLNERPRDVPVVGAPSCGEYVVRDEEGEHIVETIDLDLDEVIDYVRRPEPLQGRKDVYAIYPQGFSMVPRYEPGEVAYVDGKRPPANGDYVVVQLRRRQGDEERIVSALLKRLVRQTAEWVELEQFEPRLIFRIERARIAKMHRIFRLDELVAI